MTAVTTRAAWLPAVTAWRRALAGSCVACDLAPGTPFCAACRADFAAPETRRCRQCALRLPVDSAATCCGRCLRTRPAFDGAVTIGDYAPPLDRMVLAIKGRARLDLARACATELTVRLRDAGPWDLAVAIPLAHARLQQRGFNQSLELARPLARALGVPLAPQLLLRVRDGVPQHELPLEQRRRNVAGAFAVPAARARQLKGAQVLLVDDVMTTGATLGAGALALKQAGAARVTVAVIARTA